MQRRFVIGGIALGILGGGAVLLSRSAPGSDLLPGAAEAQESMGAAGDFEVIEMIQGDPNAPVELIEYASYTCPHCASFHANQFKDIKANYIDTGAVKFVYREVYFDRPGLWASMVARCGGEERFFGITDLIYQDQRDWTSGPGPADIAGALRRIGLSAGLTEEALDACLSDADMAQSLVNWWEENRQEHNVNSTPSFVIDGERYSNMSYSDFAEILDARLEAVGWTGTADGAPASQ